MNTRSIIAAAALTIVAGAGFAAGAGDQPAGQTGKTRAEVVAELQRARAAGEILNPDYAAAQTPTVQTGPGALTRAEVRADLERARRAGEVLDPDYDYAMQHPAPAQPSGLTRAEVVGEYKRAVAAGEVLNPDYAAAEGFPEAPNAAPAYAGKSRPAEVSSRGADANTAAPAKTGG
jgi:hypothetical protein